MNPTPVTEAEAEARDIILQWGRLHDQQAGLSAFLPLIAEEGFYMRFGEKSWVGYADFEAHQIVKRKFFDELHDYTDIQVTEGDPTVAQTRMVWTYRHRPENSPRSQLLKAHLEQGQRLATSEDKSGVEPQTRSLATEVLRTRASTLAAMEKSAVVTDGALPSTN